MTWIKIDRDENGFATEECLDKIFSHLPVVLHHNKMGGGYDVLNPQTDSLKLYLREGVKTDCVNPYVFGIAIDRAIKVLRKEVKNEKD
jgi:hypothetical protein